MTNVYVYPQTEHTKEFVRLVSDRVSFYDERAEVQRAIERKSGEIDGLKQKLIDLNQKIDAATVAVQNCLGPTIPTK